ncbi:type II secretion system protein [Demequina iriomotensis]|uniref:type II secretion system protein n=1 Tax=Demequina iriomotensis TaxID=1536641 RepID=UPI0009E2E1FB|nr:prepilin-type N-terminal cleavage/methylation domain-containing protein [Demequina iriomotensis]
MLARIRKSIEEKDQGFTLIELLVVMIIIGILAAIAIPIFLNQRKSAHDSAIKSDLRGAATEVESYYVANQKYPAAYGDFSANVKTSPGVSITYTTASGAYCLKGTNTDASQDWYYDSDNGGLLSGTATC